MDQCEVAHTDKSYSEPVLWTYIWLRARQIGLSTWVEPYKSGSGQFCLSYNRIKYELKHFFQPIFNHSYRISHPLAPDCQGRATSLPDTHVNLTMYFDVYMNMFRH